MFEAEQDVSQFHYSEIEQQLVESLPEIRPAAEFYWQTEGAPGQDDGPYIFFEQLFAAYVEVLLWLPSTPRRDELLRRAFTVSEQMFDSADLHVQGLVAIGLFEGRDPAWLKRAKPFVGRHAAAWLAEYHDCWRDCSAADDRIVPKILDGYHVRTVIARELKLPEGQVPGETYATGRLPDTPLQPRSGR
jgi:hypothetical protein